jgi:hypothetical protein
LPRGGEVGAALGGQHLQPRGAVNPQPSHETLREAGVVFSRPEGTRCFVSLRAELSARFPGLLDVIHGTADGGDQPDS